jgi:long-subunit acyl-CoA synthetase (AMP-forming)
VSETHDPIRFWSIVQPNRLALKTDRHAWTYLELEVAVAAATGALLARGLDAGEHVALEFPPEEGALFLVTFFAAQRLGLLPVVIGSGATAAERERMRSRAQTDFVLAVDDLAAAAAEAVDAMAPPHAEPEARRLDAPAAIVFTSGTSGAPRAVVLTHGNFLWSAVASARNLGVAANDRWLCCMPLHHVGGLSIPLPARRMERRRSSTRDSTRTRSTTPSMRRASPSCRWSRRCCRGFSARGAIVPSPQHFAPPTLEAPRRRWRSSRRRRRGGCARFRPTG